MLKPLACEYQAGFKLLDDHDWIKAGCVFWIPGTLDERKLSDSWKNDDIVSDLPFIVARVEDFCPGINRCQSWEDKCY